MINKKNFYDYLFQKNDNLITKTLYKHELEDVKNYLKYKQGWVYIAKSEGYPFLKIGRTKKNPHIRAKTLSTAGVLNNYEILFSIKTFNQFILEKEIHKKLKKFRITKEKEFFSISLDLAIFEIEKIFNQQEDELSKFFHLDCLKEDLNLIQLAFKN